LLSVLAKEYHTTLPDLMKKLDKVSGNLADLDRIFKGENGVSWTR